MKLAVFEAETWEREAFEGFAREHGHVLTLTERPLRASNVADYADVEIISPFIYSNLSGEILQRLKQLKFVATRSTGVDHVDADYCTRRGIPVSNVPNYGQNTVAEHVFALLLTISHHMYDAIDRTRKGDFSIEGLRGFDLAGKTLGVIGTGDIGEHVIRIARGFEMRVVAYDLQPREGLARELGFAYQELDEVLRAADVVTLHVPGTSRTRHMISHAQFDQMKRGVVLINTARGSVVDVRALMQALADGRALAAGLDVLPEEPTLREEAELLHSMFRREHNLETLLADHVLLRLRNVFITPHSAFCTNEAIQRILDVTVENIRSFISGNPRNVAIGAEAEKPAS